MTAVLIVIITVTRPRSEGRQAELSVVGVCRRAVASECESLLLPFIDFATFRSRFPYTNTVTLSQVTETSATLHAGEQVSRAAQPLPCSSPQPHPEEL